MPGGILVIDDNRHFLRTAERLLAMRGLNIFGLVAGGDDALAALENGCPDGALLDINLVGQDGFQVAAALAARCPALPIVLMSSEADTVEGFELQRCGATAFVPKVALATTDLAQFFGGPPPHA
jgi:CheY-like chemotaxis protein